MKPILAVACLLFLSCSQSTEVEDFTSTRLKTQWHVIEERVESQQGPFLLVLGVEQRNDIDSVQIFIFQSRPEESFSVLRPYRWAYGIPTSQWWIDSVVVESFTATQQQ